MKIKLFVFFLMVSALVANSQTVNVISSSEFNAIKINNSSLTDLNKTKGKKDKVEALLGTATSFNVTVNDSYYQFRYDGLKLDFSTMGKSKPYIESFELSTNTNTLTIKGITVKVGDAISTLGDVQISTARNGAKSILYSTCEDCDAFVNIEFDANNTITKISYMDMS